jgi:DNA-binding NarL/FixJ family response regulator
MTTRARTVLVVEPIADGRALAAAVRREGITVEAANDVDLALTKIASDRYGVIVVDMSTPRLSPAALSEVVRTLTPRPLVLAVTDDRRGLDPDVIHGCLPRQSDDAFIGELIGDCIAAASELSAAAPSARTRHEVSDSPPR